MTKPTIGFIGLGLMGRAMVECLQIDGFEVTVLGHRDRTGIEAALARGATEASSPRALSEASDIVMFCMGTSQQVESLVYGDDGVLAGVKPGQIVIDFGTSLPASTKKIGADMARQGAIYLDAPLGRTPAHAIDGKLNIMCAGDMQAYDRVKPVLDVLGENVFHLGPLGSGHTIKLINNFFAMTTACAMSEAFAMADMAGVERDKLYSVMAAGPLRSGMMDFIKAYAVDGDPEQLAFAIRNARKDIGYYATMVEEAGAVSLMSMSARMALGLADSGGHGEQMVTQMVDFMTSLSGNKQ